MTQPLAITQLNTQRLARLMHSMVEGPPWCHHTPLRRQTQQALHVPYVPYMPYMLRTTQQNLVLRQVQSYVWCLGGANTNQRTYHTIV